MKQSLFESRHKAEWERFALALEHLNAARKPRRSSGFPKAYRRLCQHLALAQERGYSSFLIDSLQQQVLRGHQQLVSPSQSSRPPTAELYPRRLSATGARRVATFVHWRACCFSAA
jgi:hypothetical protein